MRLELGCKLPEGAVAFAIAYMSFQDRIDARVSWLCYMAAHKDSIALNLYINKAMGFLVMYDAELVPLARDLLIEPVTLKSPRYV